jgi:hypothetical protein
MTAPDWLLDSDPAICWQELRDLVCAQAEVTLRAMRVLTWYEKFDT